MDAAASTRGSQRHRPERLQAVERLQAWTRERFALDDDSVVMASEVVCAVPGCPPLETVVAFWTTPQARHHFRVFKPIEQIVPDDLPYSWQKPTLLATVALGCECC